MSEPTFKGYFKPSPNTIQGDPDEARFMAKKLSKWGQLVDFVKDPETRAEIERFASIPEMQPAAAYQLGTGVGYVQAAYIGDDLLPTWVGGANEMAAYPVLGGEKFVSDNSKIALAARPRRIDVSLDWRTVKVEVFTLEVATDRRELDASALLPVSLDSYKLDVLRTQLRNEREVAQAAFMKTVGNYYGGSGTPFEAGKFATTLSGSTADGTAMWNSSNGWPIENVYRARAKMRKSKMRCIPDTFWMGDDVFQALSFSSQIKELVKYTGTKTDIGTGVPASALAALFNMKVVIGSAGTSGFAGGAVSDVWGQAAGLTCTAPGQVLAPRFGLTVGLAGYPSADSYEEPGIGPKRGTVQKFSDAWDLELTCAAGDTTSPAGYLWTAACDAL